MDNKDNHFWVIFDTCSRPIYRQDLYNLLALPPGSIIRYDYRDKWFSKEALKIAQTYPDDESEKKVLLVYAQIKDYNPKVIPEGLHLKNEMIWIPTRIANIVGKPMVDGDRYYFDLRLEGYPKQANRNFDEIINELIKKEEVPYKCCVCLSKLYHQFEQLIDLDETSSWQKIINELATSPSQFEDQIFWRIKVPFINQKVIDFKYSEILSEKETKKTNAFLECYQNNNLNIELVGYSKPNTTVNNNEKIPEVEVSTEPDIINLKSEKLITIRSSGNSFLEFKFNKFEQLNSGFGKITLATKNIEVGTEKIPKGANIVIQFKVRRSISTFILSFLTFMFAPLGFFVADKTYSNNSPIAVICFILALLSLGLASYLFRGKLPWDWK